MKRYAKGISIAFAFILLFGVFLNYGMVASYGNENSNLITVETFVDDTKKGDSMFGEGLWAPGVKQSKIMRITNNHSQRIRVNNLAIKMDLETQDGTVVDPESALYETYAKSMKLTITKGRMLEFFEQNLYEQSFYEILYKPENTNYQGHQLSSLKQFNVSKNDSVDLKYTITMDEGAGNELQGLKATVDFIVNLHENPTSSGSGGRRDDDKESEEVFSLVISDITGHWAEDCILKLIEAGIVVGYPDGTIKPDNTITRAETAVLITKALELEEKDKFFSGYMDYIPKWARGSIIATTEEGIFEGYPVFGVRLFKANQPITREEMATVLAKGFKITSDKDTSINFTDKDNISDWALEYVKSGIEKEVIVGYPDNTFKPQNNITRAEAFVMICKLLRYNE